MVVRLPGEKFEREASGFRSRSVARFVGRSEGDDRVKPLSLQSFTEELSFAAGRRKLALREGEERFDRGTAHVGTDALVRPAERSSARSIIASEIQPDAVLAF